MILTNIQEDCDVNTTQELFQTTDLACAAALLSVGFNLQTINNDNPQKAIFVFLREPNLDLSVKKYWDDCLLVSPQAFFSNIKRLKNRINSLTCRHEIT